MIHHANHVRPNPDGIKVGGHQASSASVVSILTALYFALPARRRPRRGQAARLAGLPRHPVPARQPAARVPDRRCASSSGLQAYPSRTKDPDPVDFSTGSVGLGAVAPAFAALATATPSTTSAQRHRAPLRRAGRRRRAGRGQRLGGGRRGGARRASATCSGSSTSTARASTGSSPASAPRSCKALFADSGWHVLEAKYGRRLQAAFARPGGEALRRRIDEMSQRGVPGADPPARRASCASACWPPAPTRDGAGRG